MDFRNISIFVLICMCLNFCNAEDVCVQKGPCSCQFSSGMGIDLTPSMNNSFYATPTYVVKKNDAEFVRTTYFYHPCGDILLNETSTIANKSNLFNTCNVPVSVCRNENFMMRVNSTDSYNYTSSNYEKMGETKLITFSSNGKSIIYKNGPSTNRSTIVTLNCVDTADFLRLESSDDPQNIVLGFYSKSACLKQLSEGGRSLGSTLLIIFFSCVIFYLVLGVAAKKFLMGATGIEVVPNLAFWTDLPNLVRDGWAFALNGFKLPPRAAMHSSPDPNSYDSI